jgi:acetylornithine deacetylase/succinyl-diaminopimelate desuccinylase-like protein
MKISGHLTFLLVVISCTSLFAQHNREEQIDRKLAAIISEHKEFLSIPNLPENRELMIQNIDWVKKKFEELGFQASLLSSSTLPLLFLQKQYNPDYKTVLFYFHIDGQPVDPAAWDQDDPFIPVLKKPNPQGGWEKLDWTAINSEINDEWRIFARAAADDKAPITMFLNALRLLRSNDQAPRVNIKIIFDPEEEYGSKAFLSTLEAYRGIYRADAMVIMDGPAHETNKPTLVFGCRGIATCRITTYGAKLPQHSGHYGNYVPNPVFSLSSILSSMKDSEGRVLIEHYYDGIALSAEDQQILMAVPDNRAGLNERLEIAKAEGVGSTYQEALQYPSLNVRQLETSWQGALPKTVIPKYARADLDVRLVAETDGEVQLEKIKDHIIKLGYRVIDHEPTTEERLKHSKLVRFETHPGVNAFRTDLNSQLGRALRQSISDTFGEEPISIRTMGGTVPIVSAIDLLGVEAIIVPTVNMDNNQHSPNENIRIGNLQTGIRTCMAILQTDL